MVNKATCFENQNKPTSIDLILKKLSSIISKFLFNRDRITIFSENVCHSYENLLSKNLPKLIHHSKYKKFSNYIFRGSLQKIFLQNSVNSCDKDVDDFLLSCNKILDQYTPRKKSMQEVIIRLL